MKKLFLFLQRSARRPEASGAKGMPVTQLATSSQHSSTTGSIFPSEAIWNDSKSYYELAQRLQKVLPPGLNRLGSGDIQIVDTQPFASGGFSEVWKGTLQGRPVAVKSLRCYSSPEFDPAKVGIVFYKEVWASSKLSHPNFVPFLGVYSTPTHPFALIYEMMVNVDIGRHLAQHPGISRLKLLIEISRALEHMHRLDITHRNIKLRNVLVDTNDVARLGGLGSSFAVSLPASWSDVESDSRLFSGIAPELIDPHAFGFADARATKATDMFAFGMLAWEVLAGKLPFDGNIEAAVILSVFRNDRPPRPVHPEVTDRVWNVIERCWDKDPLNRMTAAEVVDVFDNELSAKAPRWRSQP